MRKCWLCPNFLLPFQQKKPNQDQYFGGRKGNTSRDSDMDMLWYDLEARYYYGRCENV